MSRWLRRFGLALSIAAYALLAFHVDHADADHSTAAHHCCPCHSYSVTPNVSVALSPQAQPVEGIEDEGESPSLRRAPHSDSVPRAPPA